MSRTSRNEGESSDYLPKEMGTYSVMTSLGKKNLKKNGYMYSYS